MNPYFNGVTVLAVDLVGTLVERAPQAFTVRALEHLARKRLRRAARQVPIRVPKPIPGILHGKLRE